MCITKKKSWNLQITSTWVPNAYKVLDIQVCMRIPKKDMFIPKKDKCIPQKN